MKQNCMYYFIDITVLFNFVPFLFFLEGGKKRERGHNDDKLIQTVLYHHTVIFLFYLYLSYLYIFILKKKY